MLKTHIAACLLSTALITAPALAQTNAAPNTNQPAGRTQANPGPFLTQGVQGGAKSGHRGGGNLGH